jgi:hypothetical protein
MRLQANACLTPDARRLLVDRVRKQSWAVKAAAQAACVSRCTGHECLQRFEEAGEGGLAGRSARPLRVARCTAPRSTVSRVLQRVGMGRLWRVEEVLAPPRRCEHARRRGMFHIDARKLRRIAGVGHAMHGDRTHRRRGTGWDVTFACVDHHTRLAYALMHPMEGAVHATALRPRHATADGSPQGTP